MGKKKKRNGGDCTEERKGERESRGDANARTACSSSHVSLSLRKRLEDNKRCFEAQGEGQSSFSYFFVFLDVRCSPRPRARIFTRNVRRSEACRDLFRERKRLHPL